MMEHLDEVEKGKEGGTTFSFIIPSNTYYERKQYTIYAWNNFVADFGGYLGLLLGSSLLTLYDEGKELIAKIFRYIKQLKERRKAKKQVLQADLENSI